MQKTMLLLAAAACALSAMACGPAAYRYRAGILTPNTPEGNACRRECLALVDESDPPRFVPVLRHWQVEEEEQDWAD